jgi:hypothetical protein
LNIINYSSDSDPYGLKAAGRFDKSFQPDSEIESDSDSEPDADTEGASLSSDKYVLTHYLN